MIFKELRQRIHDLVALTIVLIMIYSLFWLMLIIGTFIFGNLYAAIIGALGVALTMFLMINPAASGR